MAQIVNELGGTLWEMVFSVSLSRRLYFVWHTLELPLGLTHFVMWVNTLRYAYPASCWNSVVYPFVLPS